MGEKIDIGLTLSGQDAIDFIEYMKNPTYTEEARELMRKAMEHPINVDFWWKDNMADTFTDEIEFTVLNDSSELT